MFSTSIGRVTMHWLLATMERLLEVEEAKELLKSSKNASKAFIIFAMSQSL
jgi:hypothetical protein